MLQRHNQKTYSKKIFAFRAVKNVKSSAIFVAKDNKTIGTDVGQINRLDSAKIACEKVNAFFPFPDALKLCINAGIKALIQPSGSKNNNEIIALADEMGI